MTTLGDLQIDFCKNLTEFDQISLKNLPYLTDFCPQLMACMHKIFQISQNVQTVFLFSILGMRTGSFELGKFVRKVENWEKLRCMKNEIPQFLQTFTNLSKLLFCLFGKLCDRILGLNTLRKCSVFISVHRVF